METKQKHSDKSVKFTEMKGGTQEDWDIVVAGDREYQKGLPERIIAHLKLLRGEFGGMQLDRLEHCLQAATRAHRDGRDEEYVVCALLHDIGDPLASFNHPDLAAAIVKRFVSERNHWMVQKHAIFQGYYFWHYIGRDRNARDQFRDHPYFDYTAEFCELYDQKAFDPRYESMPLECFEPMIRNVFKAVKNPS